MVLTALMVLVIFVSIGIGGIDGWKWFELVESFRIGNSDGIDDVGGIGNIGGAIGIDSDGIGGFDGMNGIGNNIGVSGIGWWLGWEKIVLSLII